MQNFSPAHQNLLKLSQKMYIVVQRMQKKIRFFFTLSFLELEIFVNLIQKRYPVIPNNQ